MLRQLHSDDLVSIVVADVEGAICWSAEVGAFDGGISVSLGESTFIV